MSEILKLQATEDTEVEQDAPSSAFSLGCIVETPV